MLSAPRVTRTAFGFHRLNALTGPPDQDRQERQWQYPIASGAPETSSSTAPQKQFPVNVIMMSSGFVKTRRAIIRRGHGLGQRRPILGEPRRSGRMRWGDSPYPLIGGRSAICDALSTARAEERDAGGA